MREVLFGFKTDTDEREKRPAANVKIGSLVEIPFASEADAIAFAAGYRSGMARIWRTTYEMPMLVNSAKKRGVRFAWLCHVTGRMYRDEFPEVEVVICRQ